MGDEQGKHTEQDLPLGDLRPPESFSAGWPTPAAESSAPPPPPPSEAMEAEAESGADYLALAEEELPEQQYCIFRAGRERYCLAVLDVEEVVEWPRLTPLPLAPSFLMGIFNLRGSVAPVIDIAFTEGRRADLPPRHVVVARVAPAGERGEMQLGIAADEVIGTYSTSEPLMQDEAPKEVPYCCGMLRHEDRLALALDLQRLTQAFPVPVI